jgi:hypothetical protein
MEILNEKMINLVKNEVDIILNEYKEEIYSGEKQYIPYMMLQTQALLSKKQDKYIQRSDDDIRTHRALCFMITNYNDLKEGYSMMFLKDDRLYYITFETVSNSNMIYVTINVVRSLIKL